MWLFFSQGNPCSKGIQPTTFVLWVWVRIRPLGDRRLTAGFSLCFHLSGQAILGDSWPTPLKKRLPSFPPCGLPLPCIKKHAGAAGAGRSLSKGSWLRRSGLSLGFLMGFLMGKWISLGKFVLCHPCLCGKTHIFCRKVTYRWKIDSATVTSWADSKGSKGMQTNIPGCCRVVSLPETNHFCIATY